MADDPTTRDPAAEPPTSPTPGAALGADVSGPPTVRGPPVQPRGGRRPRRRRRALRMETVGGAVLLVAAVVAVVWANLPVRDAYEELRVVPYAGSLVVGPFEFPLDLSLSAWAADGLLAIFFFIVGLELKREFRAGSLRRPSQAAMPILAAVGRHDRAGAVLRRGDFSTGPTRCAAGPSPPPRTSPSRSRCSPSSAPSCRAPCARSCSRSPSSTTCSPSSSSPSSTPRSCGTGYLLGALVPILLFALLVQRRITAE